eukprot:TRINITY_DN5168_c0_g1_i4.p1 TRINITY_DN5168_c0_g1~~TRINITY_DN5168_c0_g1_i4.p1  ORF type:complete len:364 (+),score=62.81 TRINITY_DN5168_c0_g1_i4:87-1178(+)
MDNLEVVWYGPDKNSSGASFHDPDFPVKVLDHGLEIHQAFAEASAFAIEILKTSMEYFNPQRPGFQQLLLDDPVKSVNCMCRARRLGIVPKHWLDETWAAYQRVWKADRRTQQLELYVYGLTHFILDSTDFYQSRINLDLFSKQYEIISRIDSGSAFREILQYFEDQADSILQLADPDLLSEVGLCFRVCGRDTSTMCQRCTAYVRSMVRFCKLEQRVLLYKPGRSASRGLQREEHLNCVGLLLLSSWPRSFYRGPRYSTEEWDTLIATLPAEKPPADVHLQRSRSESARFPPRPKERAASRTRQSVLGYQKPASQAQLVRAQASTIETYAEKRKRLQALGILSSPSQAALRLSRMKPEASVQ